MLSKSSLANRTERANHCMYIANVILYKHWSQPGCVHEQCICMAICICKILWPFYLEQKSILETPLAFLPLMWVFRAITCVWYDFQVSVCESKARQVSYTHSCFFVVYLNFLSCHSVFGLWYSNDCCLNSHRRTESHLAGGRHLEVGVDATATDVVWLYASQQYKGFMSFLLQKDGTLLHQSFESN